MKEYDIAMLLFIIPTILWLIIGFLFYLAMISEFTMPQNIHDFVLLTPVWQINMVLFIGYFLSLTVGIVYYAEMKFAHKI